MTKTLAGVRPKTGRALMKTLTLSLLLLLCAVRAGAQSTTDGSTPLGVAPGSPTGSYALSDIDTVNLYNGGLNFRLPLLKVGGRGGAGYPITLHIEQKWTVHKEKIEPSYPYSYWAEPEWWSEEGGGWRTFDVGKIHIRRGKSAQYDLRCGTYVPRETLTRLTFSAPDGTEYELRDQATNGQPVWPQCGGGFNRGRVFVTADGSSATFISDSDIIDIFDWSDDSEIYPSGYMLLKDGTRFRVQSAKIVWMRDRNGNKVTFTHDLYGRVTGVADSLGRQVTITHPTSSAALYTDINFTGFGGAARTIRIGQTNLSSVLRADQTLQTPQQLFPGLNGWSANAQDPAVIGYVELPDGRRYQFQYNSYAELARIILPTGGAIEYDYAAGITDGAASGLFTVGSDKFVYRRVTERRVYPAGGSGAGFASKTTYSRPETMTTNAGLVVVDQVGPGGTLLARTRHYFHGSARASFGQKPTAYPAYKDGREYRTESLASDGSTLLRVVEQTFAQRAPVGWWTGDAELAPPNDPRVTQVVTALADTNQVSKQTFAYDGFNNQTDLWEYDFGSGAPSGHPLRHTHTDYLTVNNGIDYTSHTGPHLRGLPSAQQVYTVNPQTGAETLNTKSETRYDEAAYAPLTYGTVSGWEDPGTSARGMATTSRRWLDTSSTWVEMHVQYDQVGNARKAWDARGNLSQVEYDDAYADGVARNTFALATRTVSAVPDPSGQNGSAAPLVGTKVYDFSTGLTVSATDANGQVTTVQYSDPLERPTAVIRPAGGGQTQYVYGDTPGNLYVRTLTDLDASRKTDSYKYFDGMGRPFRSLQYENQDPSKPWLTVDTEYDSLGRVKRTSAPYRAAAGAPLFSTDKWSETAYDVLGRPTTVTSRPDNAAETTSYVGNQVTVTDQTGKQSRTVTNALERVTQVIEDPAGLAYVTNYQYDASGSLRRVEQGGQLRYFMYDTLGRLVRVRMPEQAVNASLALTDGLTGNSQWSAAHSYDAAGNLSQRTDARGVTATYAYDGLNRNTSISYTDGTMGVGRAYDKTANGAGRLSWDWTCGDASNCGSHTTYTYDALGRVSTRNQYLWSNGGWGSPYTTSYAYDLASNVVGLTYPSGHAVGYAYDAAGRLSGFSGNVGDGAARNYAAGIVYDELGGVRQEQFGTDTPIYNKRFYNSRGQLAEVRVSTYSVTTPGQETNWNRGAILNTYSMLDGWTSSREDNNGSLRKQMIFVPHDDAISGYTMLVQYYGYDSLGRLSSVEDKLDNNVTNFRQTYVYDRWGNRTINASLTTNAPATQFTVDAATNRLGVPGGYGGRMDYDAAGNLVNDSYSGYGSGDGTPTRAFDAEGRMTSARDAYGQNSVSGYDGDGRRVRRRAGAADEVWQVYGAGGELLAEYAAGAPASQPQREYGYRGGELLVSAAGPGTGPRVNFAASANGATATASSAYDPYGLYTTNAINGSRTYAGSYWNDLTAGSFPDWLQINFAGSKSVGEVDLYFLQDNYATAEPTESMTFTQMGVTSFDVQYWTGSAWATVPGGSVSGNNKVWRKLTFPAVTTTAIRLVVNGASDWWTRVVEVEAYAPSAGAGEPGVRWMVHDQLGTPRMVIDQTGSLAGVKRHDYLPFGEEAPTGWGGRTADRGYAADAVRQKFTGYERDAETRLDYARARYYSSEGGRFISPDPLLSSGRITAPQSWNRYAYCLNSPLGLTDPDGLMWAYRDGGNGVWYLRWVNGDKLSASMQKAGWRAYNGPNRLQLAHRNGFVQLHNGFAEVWLGPNMQMKNTGQGYVNMAAGMIDSAPGGHWIRMKTRALTYADENSGEYKNTKIIATGVSAAKAIKGLAAIGTIGYRALKSLGDDAAEGGVQLFRAVKQAELDDIVESGTYRAGGAAIEGKYFFENADDAAGFAKKMYNSFPNEGAYTITSTVVDDAVIKASSRLHIAGEGMSVVVPGNKLPLGPVKVYNSAPVPK